MVRKCDRMQSTRGYPIEMIYVSMRFAREAQQNEKVKQILKQLRRN